VVQRATGHMTRRYPALTVDKQCLPVVEVKTRGAISQETTAEFKSTSDVMPYSKLYRSATVRCPSVTGTVVVSSRCTRSCQRRMRSVRAAGLRSDDGARVGPFVCETATPFRLGRVTAGARYVLRLPR